MTSRLFFSHRSVSNSVEVRRILNLPRREWTPEIIDYLVRELTDALKMAGGK